MYGMDTEGLTGTDAADRQFTDRNVSERGVTERERAAAQRLAEWTARSWYLLNRDRVPPVELEDLEQEARIGAFRAEERFRRGGPAPFPAFAQRAALGAIRHYLQDALGYPRAVAEGQRAARAWELPPVSLDDPSPDRADLPHALAESLATPGSRPVARTEADLLERIPAALGGLPRRQRQIIHRKFWRRQSGSRIARSLHLPAGLVGRELRTGLDRLRDRLQRNPLADNCAGSPANVGRTPEGR